MKNESNKTFGELNVSGSFNAELLNKEVDKTFTEELLKQNVDTTTKEIKDAIEYQLNKEGVNNGLSDVANNIWNGIKDAVKKTTDFISDSSYEIIKGAIEGTEGIVDSTLSLVADLSDLCGNEQFKEKVVEVIKEDYSSAVLRVFEPLNNDCLEGMEEVGTIMKTIARATGMTASGMLLGGPAGGIASALVGEAGNSIESYYKNTGSSEAVSIQHEALTGNGENATVWVRETANPGDNITNKFNYVIDVMSNKIDEFIPALMVAGIRTTETVVDMVGNVALGITKFGEGIVDEVVSVAGMAIPSFREQASDFVSFDFSGSTVGTFFDNVTKDSYLNDNEIGKLVEGVCQGLGQIAPALVLSVVTGGAAAPAAGTVAAVNLGLLSASAAGRGTEKALNDQPDTTYERAFIYGQISGAIEGAIESISGGIGAFGPGLIKQFGETFVGSVVGEGLEEVVSGLIDPVLEKIYKDQNLKDIYMSTEFWQGIIEQFVIGAGTAAVANGLTSHIKIDTKPSTSEDIVVVQDGFISVETAEQISIKEDIVNKVDSGELKLGENGMHWTKEMGNYGEMRTAVEFTRDGYVELTRSPMELADRTMPINGIDHVFYKDGITYIVDSKSGDGAHLGTLADGTKQLSDAWWNARLDNAVTPEVADAIRESWILNPDSVVRVVSQVDVGKETIYKIVDPNGNITIEGGNLDELLK